MAAAIADTIMPSSNTMMHPRKLEFCLSEVRVRSISQSKFALLTARRSLCFLLLPVPMHAEVRARSSVAVVLSFPLKLSCVLTCPLLAASQNLGNLRAACMCVPSFAFFLDTPLESTKIYTFIDPSAFGGDSFPSAASRNIIL